MVGILKTSTQFILKKTTAKKVSFCDAPTILSFSKGEGEDKEIIVNPSKEVYVLTYDEKVAQLTELQKRIKNYDFMDAELMKLIRKNKSTPTLVFHLRNNYMGIRFGNYLNLMAGIYKISLVRRKFIHSYFINYENDLPENMTQFILALKKFNCVPQNKNGMLDNFNRSKFLI